MISSVQAKCPKGNLVATLKLSIAAMVRLERRNGGRSVSEILGSLEGGLSVDTVAQIFREAMNDGAGCESDDEAWQVIEAIGLAQASGLVAEMMTAAFPEAEASAGNQKKPSRKK